MKKVLILLSLATLVSIAGYMYWLRTPQYSLQQILKAVESKDIYMFEQYVDIDGIIDKGVDVYVTHAMEEQGSGLGEAISIGMIQMMKPKMIGDIKSEVVSFIETGDTKYEVIRNQLTSGEASVDIEIKEQGNIAFLLLKFINSNNDNTITGEFKLSKTSDYWRVVELTNLQDIIEQRVAQAKARIDAANALVQPRLNNLNVSKVETRLIKQNKYSSEDIELTVHLENTGVEIMRDLVLSIDVLDNQGNNLVKTVKLQVNKILPGQSGSKVFIVDLNMFNKEDEMLKKLPQGEIKYAAQVTSFKASNGDVVALK